MLSRIALATCLLLVGGIADAGPFSRLRGGSCSPAWSGSCGNPSYNSGILAIVLPSPAEVRQTSPIGTIPSPESPTDGDFVPQPWSEPETMEPTSLQAPDTALEAIPGTGSKLPIGNAQKLPDLLKQLDALKKQLDLALVSGSGQNPKVDIALPLPDGTSQQLQRVLTLTEALLWLLGTLGTGSLAGKLLPLVARVASGLQSVATVPSSASPPIPGGTSSTATNSSSAASQAAP